MAGLIAALIVIPASALFDIASAPASVRKYNERSVIVAPSVNPRTGSSIVSVAWNYGRSTALRRTPEPRLPASGDSNSSRKSPGVGFALSPGSSVVPLVAAVGLYSASKVCYT